LKIMLILPNFYATSRVFEQDAKEPLGLLYLTSVLRQKGHHVEIFDASRYGFTIEQTAAVIERVRPDVLGLSIVQRAVVTSMALVEYLRRRKVPLHICVGGYYPSLATENLAEIADKIDSVVVGEGEETFPDLLDCLERGRDWHDIAGTAWLENGRALYASPRPKIAELDDIPFPARDLLPDVLREVGFASLFSSRGCYGRCTFCSQNAFQAKNPGPRWRGRSPGNVVDEMELLYDQYGVRTYKFNDDNIFGPGPEGRRRVEDICHEILRRELDVHLMAYCRVNDVTLETAQLMREAGFERLLVGVESASDETLARFKKGINQDDIQRALGILKKVGISMVPGFMMFDPYSTVDGLKDNLAFLRDTEAYGISIHKNLKVHDSAPIKSELLREGRLRLVNSLDGYHEYVVPTDLARVYMMNKLLWVYYVDPIAAESRVSMQIAKRMESFNERECWEDALKRTWLAQVRFMEETIRWAKEQPRGAAEIRPFVEDILREIAAARDFRASISGDGPLQPSYLLGIVHLDGEAFVMDLTSSRLLQIPSAIEREGINLLMDGATLSQTTETLRERMDEAAALQVTGWVKANLTPADRVTRTPLSADDFIDELIQLLHGPIDPILPEKYVWWE